jgi:hypothetical protein
MASPEGGNECLLILIGSQGIVSMDMNCTTQELNAVGDVVLESSEPKGIRQLKLFIQVWEHTDRQKVSLWL